MRHLLDERDERGVVYLHWRSSQVRGTVIVNRILVPCTLVRNGVLPL